MGEYRKDEHEIVNRIWGELIPWLETGVYQHGGTHDTPNLGRFCLWDDLHLYVFMKDGAVTHSFLQTFPSRGREVCPEGARRAYGRRAGDALELIRRTFNGGD